MLAFPMAMDRTGASGALVKMVGFSVDGNSTLVYFSCEDCATGAARIIAFCGKIERAKTSIGDYGFIVLAYGSKGKMFGRHSQK